MLTARYTRTGSTIQERTTRTSDSMKTDHIADQVWCRDERDRDIGSMADLDLTDPRSTLELQRRGRQVLTVGRRAWRQVDPKRIRRDCRVDAVAPFELQLVGPLGHRYFKPT